MNEQYHATLATRAIKRAAKLLVNHIPAEDIKLIAEREIEIGALQAKIKEFERRQSTFIRDCLQGKI